MPKRIVKLYGTWARKGDDTPALGRPHRESGVIEIPDDLAVVPVTHLESLAGATPSGGAPSGRTTLARPGSPGQVAPPAGSLLRRAEAYLAEIPPAVSGEGGHDQTFKAACALVLGFGLSVEEALPLLKGWNEACQPPWSEKELLHKLRDADAKGGARGALAAGAGRAGSPGCAPPLREDDDPHRLARVVLGASFSFGDSHTLRFWRGQWWRWSGNAYGLFSEAELDAALWSALEVEFGRLAAGGGAVAANGKLRDPLRARKVTQGLVANVRGALASLVIVPDSAAMPSWLGGGGRSDGFLALDNGILDLGGLLRGGAGVVLDHSPLWFSAVKLPYGHDPLAACPAWLAFLAKNLEGDAERIALLQEWFGYCLLHDTSHQRFLLLQGEGCNGKSVACAVLTALLGEANVSNVALESFGQRFALASTLGKLANVASEVGELDKAAEGTLKAFTSGDRMTFDRKGIAPVEEAPSARLVLATNNLPRFADRSGGIWRRMLLVPFRVEITPAERVPGMDKPGWWLGRGELPGVFNWAVDGLRRLRQQGRFTEAAVCAEALEQYRTENNPARTFLTECCVGAAAGQVPCQLLYEGYARWCKSNGCQALGSAAFGKEVKRVFPGAEKRKAGGRAGRHHAYHGIEYHPPEWSLSLPALPESPGVPA